MTREKYNLVIKFKKTRSIYREHFDMLLKICFRFVELWVANTALFLWLVNGVWKAWNSLVLYGYPCRFKSVLTSFFTMNIFLSKYIFISFHIGCFREKRCEKVSKQCKSGTYTHSSNCSIKCCRKKLCNAYGMWMLNVLLRLS